MHACMHAGTMQDRWEMSWRYLWNHRYLSRTYVQASCFHLLTKFRRKTENVQANAPWPRPCPQKQSRQEQQGAGLLSPVCLPVALCSSVFFASARPSTCPFVRPSVRPSAGPSVRPSVASSFFLYFRPSVRRSLDWLASPSFAWSVRPGAQPAMCVRDVASCN